MAKVIMFLYIVAQWCDWAVLGRKPEKGRAVESVVLSVQNLLFIPIFLH